MLPDLKAHTLKPFIASDAPHILEIGANDASDTLEFLEVFPHGRVSCFECDPRAISIWRKRIHRDHPRATLYESALGERCGIATFHQSGGMPPGVAWEGVDSWDKSGSLLAPDRHSEYEPWLTFPTTIEVPVLTLDSWRGDDESIVDFAWIDVQGAEAAVLRGAQKTIRKIKWWYCEVHCLPYYHGQATLQEIKGLLPGFVFHSEHLGENFLFRNTEI